MGLLNINNGVSQEKGITYTVIIDDISNDFGDVSNNTYFLDKQTQLVYYKNSTGDLVSIYEQGGSNLTGSAGNGLTYNTTTNQIDLGGDIGIDPDPTKNDLYFTPVSHGIYINYGLTSDGYASTFTSSGLVETYRIDTIRTHTWAGYENMIGPFNNGNHLPGNPAREGVFEKQGPNTYIKSYQNLTPSFDSNSKYVSAFTGDGVTHYISESLNSTYRTIFDTHTGTVQPLIKSRSTHVLDNFTWEVSNEDTVDPTIERSTSFVIRRTDIGASVPSDDGSNMGIFVLRSDTINLMDGTNSGIMTAPDWVFIGKFGGSGLELGSGTFPSGNKFKDGSNDKKGIKYSGFGETPVDEDTGVGADYSTLVNTSLVPKKYVDDAILNTNNIYNTDGSLTGDRTIDLDGNSLTFNKNYDTNKDFIINSYPYPSHQNPYFKINRYGGIEIISADAVIKGNAITVIDGIGGSDKIFEIGRRGGGSWNGNSRTIIIGQETSSSWKFAQSFNDGYISFSNGNNWTDNEQIRFDLRNNTNPELTFLRNAQGSSGNRFIVRNDTTYETNHGISKEQISLQGNTLIKGDSGLERTPYNFKIVNSSDDNTFVTNDDKSIEVYGRTELLSKEHGILLNRVDVSEMNSISASDNEIVYNTELESLYRYDDPSGSWIALASGYGMVGVVRDSDNGVPTFYSDLQSALDTCKTLDSYNTVTLYSNHTTTTGIIIDNTFEYKHLTINFNGFKIENTQSDDTHCLTIGGLIVGATTVLLDGSLIRENGTTGKCVQHDGGTRNIRMSKMYIYNENHITLGFAASTDGEYDFGGSIFETGPSATINTLRGSYSMFKNFTAISNSSIGALFLTNGAKATNFTVINKSTGAGITTQSSCIASNFYAESNSGNAVGSGIFSNFVAKSVSGVAVNGPIEAHDFVATTGDNIAVNIGGENVSNFRAENNSSTNACVYMSNTEECVQVYAKNKGSGYAIHVFRNQANRSFSYNRITAISEGGIAANLSSNTGFKILFSHCEFVSKWNDVGGHSVRISGNDTVLTNCSFRVNNVGANNITSDSAITTKVTNSTFDGATTPINSNVTLSNIQETTSTATFTINADEEKMGVLTSMDTDTTIAAPTGTPLQGQKLILRFKDDGTPRTLTWDVIFRSIGVTLPTTTTSNKTLYLGFVYNTTDTQWDCVAVNEEA